MSGDENGASARSGSAESVADVGMDESADEFADPADEIDDPVDGLDRSIDPPTVGDEVEVPTPGRDLADADVDREVATVFWKLVVVMDVALLAVALGPMFVYFEGDWERGLAMTGLGIVAAVYGVRTYRSFREDDEESDA